MSEKTAFRDLTTLTIALLLLTGCVLWTGCRQPAGQTAPVTTPIPETTALATVKPTAEPTATIAATTAGTTGQNPAETTEAPLPLNPLTGLPLSDPAAAGRRPLALIINNHRQAVPQIGIGAADLIYEMLVEGGITRQMAVFADARAIPEIGSIRSARHDYIDLAGGLDAILVHIGESKLANEQFKSQNTEHIDLHAFSNSYWRDPDWYKNRGYEHSVKTTGEHLLGALGSSSFRTAVRDGQAAAFLFRPADRFEPAGPQAAPEVRIRYSDYCVATFTYDPASRLYRKGQYGRDQIDLATGRALQFTNVFLVMTRVVTLPDGILKDADLTAGQGYYISGGQALPVSWRKGRTDDRLVFLDDQGNELMVNAGKSYVGIVPQSARVSLGG